MKTNSRTAKESKNQTDSLLLRLIELTENNMIVNLYLRGASRDQIKSVVGVGTKKADKVISKIKHLKKDI